MNHRPASVLSLAELVRLKALRTDAAILLLLGYAHDVGCFEAAERLGLEISTVSMAVSRLNRDNLIYLTTPVADLRRGFMRLTPGGIDRVRELQNCFVEFSVIKKSQP